MRIVLGLILVAFLAGCTPTQNNLTSEQKLQRDERTVRVATGVAVRATLMAIDPAQADQLARDIREVAVVIHAAATEGDVDLTLLLDGARKSLSKIEDTRRRQLAITVVTSIASVAQVKIEETLDQLEASQKAVLVRRLIAAAAQGAIESTDVWLILSPTK